MSNRHKLASLVLVLLSIAVFASAQGAITSPKQEFGFNVGDDYQLVNYTRLLAYWKKLDRESDRMSLVQIGTSSEGRPMVMAVISASKNFGRLDVYKQTAKRLALAKGLTDAEAKKLSAAGKAVVWIDGGLHASEIVGSQQLIELVYRMLSGRDAETLRILDEVILLATPVNPDGLELVADWYMREKDPLKRSTSGLPRLYQKYIGHDNNRDYYMVTQPETEAVSRQLYIEWHPQFIYNHHQTGPAGTVLFCPPFRDPFYYYFDPLVPVGTDMLGLAMHERFAAENKPGAIMRSGASYSTWWNGGLRSTGYFHNIIGILTEMIGNPTPIDIPFIPDRVLPKGDYPFPIMPQKWHMRQSIEYSITADKAILDFASRRREEILFNRYIMGKNAIAKGSRDNWTFEPRQIAALQAQIETDRTASASPAPAAAPQGQRPGGMRGGGVNIKYYETLRDPAKRDPRGFIIPADQPDFPTAIKFLNTLMKSGVTVQRAVKSFTVGGKTYPQGSYIVQAAQAFRSHVISMFEPQDHPNDFAYPGGPPRPPYDSAGWTVAFQMGIKFDRVLEGFDGPFEELRGFAKPPAGAFPANALKSAAGFLVSHEANDAFILTNRLLKADEEIYWMKKSFQANGKTYPAGTIYVPAKESAVPILEKASKDLGLNIELTDLKPSGEAFRLKAPRVGLWDSYGGSMDSGWAQWILTQFEFPFEVVYAPALDTGDLRAKYDILIFVEGGIPGLAGAGGRGGMGGFGQPSLESVPQEYRGRVGRISVDKTIPQIKKFLDEGGAVLTISGSTSLGYHLALPIANHLVEKTADGREVPLTTQKFYVPGSVLRVRVDNAHPLAFGMPELLDVFFDNNPVFDLTPEAGLIGIQAVAWFENANPLRSGWVWGDQYLRRGVEVIAAPVGQGKLFLFAPEIAFRGQPHGTFKFLFNGIFYGAAESVNLN